MYYSAKKDTITIKLHCSVYMLTSATTPRYFFANIYIHVLARLSNISGSIGNRPQTLLVNKLINTVYNETLMLLLTNN